MNTPNPIVATGKIGDLAIKTGKPVEAKVVLYRNGGTWTIDDLIALQETAVLTIILQPQMAQRPLPMQPVEEAPAPTFTETDMDMETGDITGIHFDMEKIGDEDKLFAAIAPYVRSGSFLELVGEDGERWRWVWHDGTFEKQRGRVVFEGAS